MIVRSAKKYELVQINNLRGKLNSIRAQYAPGMFKPGFSSELQEYLYTIFENPQQRILVVTTDNDAIMGYAIVSHMQKAETLDTYEQDYIVINEFNIDDQYAETEAATRLIQYIKKKALESRAEYIAYDVWEFNSAQRHFMYDMGFHVTKRNMFFSLKEKERGISCTEAFGPHKNIVIMEPTQTQDKCSMYHELLMGMIEQQNTSCLVCDSSPETIELVKKITHQKQITVDLSQQIPDIFQILLDDEGKLNPAFINIVTDCLLSNSSQYVKAQPSEQICAFIKFLLGYTVLTYREKASLDKTLQVLKLLTNDQDNTVEQQVKKLVKEDVDNNIIRYYYAFKKDTPENRQDIILYASMLLSPLMILNTDHTDWNEALKTPTVMLVTCNNPVYCHTARLYLATIQYYLLKLKPKMQLALFSDKDFIAPVLFQYLPALKNMGITSVLRFETMDELLGLQTNNITPNVATMDPKDYKMQAINYLCNCIDAFFIQKIESPADIEAILSGFRKMRSLPETKSFKEFTKKYGTPHRLEISNDRGLHSIL